MKLLRIELLNLASLDKADGEIIDFENGPLGESNIFSIVGPTGSGKSTILDAICLALFNRAPRYPKKKNDRNQSIEIYGKKNEEESCRLAPSDPRNILTHGKKYGYSKLTFLANNGTIVDAVLKVRNLSGIVDVVNSAGDEGRPIYDLQGRRVVRPVRGIYVSNGRKILMK